MVKIKLEIAEIKGECSNGMKVGDQFFLDGYTFRTSGETKICIWALNGILLSVPLLIERKDIRKDHWIKDLKRLSCPDNKVFFTITEIDE
jgi:uncharacterized repeat protein (TIGR04076 family)